MKFYRGLKPPSKAEPSPSGTQKRTRLCGLPQEYGCAVARPYIILFMIFGLLMVLPARAQTIGAPQQVFIIRDYDVNGRDRLVFIDLLTGEERYIDVPGDRYTALPGGVLYVDTEARRVMYAAADGVVSVHPFIQLGEARRIDWIISPDRTRIAWTLTSGSPTALTTVTAVAALDGSQPTTPFTDGPREGIRAFPVAFSADGSALIMDFQPDTLGDLTPFRQYAALFSVDLATGERRSLPGEPGCFCGAGTDGRLFVRMGLAGGRAGFDLNVYNLGTGARQTIPGLSLDAYTQGGDVLISPDGTRALYALAQVRNFGTPNQTLQTVFVLVDLLTMTQRPLVQPINTLIRPLAWTEDNTAVLFTSPIRNGTWKLNIADDTLHAVAEAAYVGVIGLTP